MTLARIHHGIMKGDAITDYNRMKAYCEKYNKPIHEPKGKHWHKIEDATALMVEQFDGFEVGFNLLRGVSYYQTLNT